MRLALVACGAALGALAVGAGAQSPGAGRVDERDVAARIRRVEEGLLPPNIIAGRPLPAMSLAERMQVFRVPGVSIAVVNQGRIEWARGYGVAEAGSGRAVDTATLFQAASISKPVATLAALRLVEEGTLALDEDVNARLTSWRVPESELARDSVVTLRRIFSHNAGLTVHGFRGYARDETVPTTVQVLDGSSPANSAPVRVDVVPGTLHRYSGGGFTVAQLLMSEVTGKPFERLMHDLVLGPLDMIHSTYAQPLPDSLAARAATAHRDEGIAIPGSWHTYPEQAAAGLWTTPVDLARMIIAVQRYASGEAGGVISPAMARQMLTRQAGSYGIGFGLEGEGAARIFAHGGSNAGFRAMFVGFVETGQGAVVMTNGDLGGLLVQEVLRGIAHVYGWEQFKATEKTVVAVDSAQLAALAGRYRVEGAGQERILTVTLNEGRLEVRSPGWLSARTLHASAPDRFFMLESAAELRFERDEAGRATAIELSGGGPPVRAARIE